MSFVTKTARKLCSVRRCSRVSLEFLPLTPAAHLLPIVQRRRPGLHDSGQSSVEAAFAIPIVFLLLLLITQPAIIWYDRMIMEEAAAEGCRLLATAGLAESGSTAEDYIRRRLSAIPQVPWFHVHEGSCSYEISLEGNEASEDVTVTLKNELRPLPLLGSGATLLSLTNASGCLEIVVTKSFRTQPDWVWSATGGESPGAWVGKWLSL